MPVLAHQRWMLPNSDAAKQLLINEKLRSGHRVTEAHYFIGTLTIGDSHDHIRRIFYKDGPIPNLGIQFQNVPRTSLKEPVQRILVISEPLSPPPSSITFSGADRDFICPLRAVLLLNGAPGPYLLDFMAMSHILP